MINKDCVVHLKIILCLILFFKLYFMLGVEKHIGWHCDNVYSEEFISN